MHKAVPSVSGHKISRRGISRADSFHSPLLHFAPQRCVQRDFRPVVLRYIPQTAAPWFRSDFAARPENLRSSCCPTAETVTDGDPGFLGAQMTSYRAVRKFPSPYTTALLDGPWFHGVCASRSRHLPLQRMASSVPTTFELYPKIVSFSLSCIHLRPRPARSFRPGTHHGLGPLIQCAVHQELS